MKTRLSILILIIIVFLLSCQKNPVPQSDRPMIVTSVYPVYDILRNILQDEAVIFYAIPAGANPHTFEPKPSLIQKLQGSQLFVGVHPHLDGWIQSLIPNSNKILYLSQLVEETPVHEDEHHLENPHLWLSLQIVKDILPQLSDSLSNWFEESGDALQKNTNIYIQKIDSMDLQLQKQFNNIQDDSFIQWHPAWDRFAEDYGLHILGTLNHGHGDNPSIIEFQQLIQSAKEQNVHVVVIGLYVEDPAVKTLCDAIDGRLLRLDTLGDADDPERDTYLDLMRFNGERLTEALLSCEK